MESLLAYRASESGDEQRELGDSCEQWKHIIVVMPEYMNAFPNNTWMSPVSLGLLCAMLVAFGIISVKETVYVWLLCCQLCCNNKGLRIQRGGTQGREVASNASGVVCLTLMQRKGWVLTQPHNKGCRGWILGRKSLNSWEELYPISLGAGQHPISPGYSQEQAGLFLEGNPSPAWVPSGLSCILGSSLMVSDEKTRGALGRVVFRPLHMPRDFSP